jgi:tricorn protease-like protein
MTVKRIALWAILGGVVLTGILACFSCREKVPEEEPTPMLQTSPAVLEPAIEITGRIVFQSDLDGDDDIYLLQGRQIIRLTDNDWDDRYPRWSPDGTKIAYLANPKSEFDLFIMEVQGGRIAQVTDSAEEETDLSWTPDGLGIAFSVETGRTLRKQRSIWMEDLTSGTVGSRFLRITSTARPDVPAFQDCLHREKRGGLGRFSRRPGEPRRHRTDQRREKLPPAFFP